MANMGAMTYNLTTQKNNLKTAEEERTILKKEQNIIMSEREEVGKYWTSPGAQETLGKLDKFLVDDLNELEKVFHSVQSLLEYVEIETDKINRTGQYT